MCSCVCLFACAHWTWPVSSLWPKPQAGVLYRGEGSLLMIQAQPMAPSFKRPPIIAPTYSQRRMSVNVDHAIHQLRRAQGPSNTGTADPRAASCLVYRLNPPSPPPSATKLKAHLLQEELRWTSSSGLPYLNSSCKCSFSWQAFDNLSVLGLWSAIDSKLHNYQSPSLLFHSLASKPSQTRTHFIHQIGTFAHGILVK